MSEPLRALVIGSSHVGALRGAAPSVEAANPQVAFDFFGVMGPNFLPASIGKDGVFQPRYRGNDVKGREIAMGANGAETVDTTPYAHVLLVGYRFAFDQLAGLLAENDLLEGARTGRARVIPQSLLVDAIDTLTGEAVDRFIRKMRGRSGLCVSLAPYPATSIVDSTRAPDLARTCREFWAHPEAQPLFDDWLAVVRQRLGDAGHHLLEQPAQTVAGPFATHSGYATGRRTMSGDSTEAETDHRHMNVEFGRLVLEAYIKTHLAPAAAGTLSEATQ